MIFDRFIVYLSNLSELNYLPNTMQKCKKQQQQIFIENILPNYWNKHLLRF